MLGEWVGQKRRKKNLEYYIDKGLPWEAIDEEATISKGPLSLQHLSG